MKNLLLWGLPLVFFAFLIWANIPLNGPITVINMCFGTMMVVCWYIALVFVTLKHRKNEN